MTAPRVLFVPGLTGSMLYAAGFGPVKRVVWLSPGGLATGGLAKMKLPTGEPGDETPLNAIEPGGPIMAYYGHLIFYLAKRGFQVITAKCDWRLPIESDARRLASQIAEDFKGRPVLALAHSRGGLVLRRALEIVDQAALQRDGCRVVGLGVPHEGSLNAVSALGCWDTTKQSIARIGKMLPTLVGKALGLSVIGDVMRTWPSVYELLPDPRSRWVEGVNPSVFYNPATYADSPFRPLPAYLSAAEARWRSVQPIPPGVLWCDVYGYNVPTWFTIQNATKLPFREAFGASNNGDGTVPLPTSPVQTRPEILVPTQHDALPLDGRWFNIYADRLYLPLRESQKMDGRVVTFAHL